MIYRRLKLLITTADKYGIILDVNIANTGIVVKFYFINLRQSL